MKLKTMIKTNIKIKEILKSQKSWFRQRGAELEASYMEFGGRVEIRV
jgi:hypothetical protein